MSAAAGAGLKLRAARSLLTRLSIDCAASEQSSCSDRRHSIDPERTSTVARNVTTPSYALALWFIIVHLDFQVELCHHLLISSSKGHRLSALRGLALARLLTPESSGFSVKLQYGIAPHLETEIDLGAYNVNIEQSSIASGRCKSG